MSYFSLTDMSTNTNILNLAHDPVQHDRTKPMEIDHHFIKDHLKKGNICTPFLPMYDQLVDVFTKGLPGAQFMSLVCKLGMLDIHSPAGGVLECIHIHVLGVFWSSHISLVYHCIHV